MNPWSLRDYWRERTRFVQARAHRTSVLGVALVFGTTTLAGWLCSVALRVWAGVTSMPLRYAISALLAYAVFFGCVRVWADFQRRLPSESDRGDWSAWSDLPLFDGEGCLIALGFLALGVLLSAGLWAFGGFAALLEVAFEVAFAGTVVKSALRPGFVVGRWWQVLWRRTALPAALLTVVMVAIAVVAQRHFPDAQTLTQVLRQAFPAR